MKKIIVLLLISIVAFTSTSFVNAQSYPFQLELTQEKPFDMYDASGTAYYWVHITYEFPRESLALVMEIPNPDDIYIGTQVVPGGTLYSRAYLYYDRDIIGTAEYGVIETWINTEEPIRLELSNMFDVSEAGLLANRIELYLLIDTSTYSEQDLIDLLEYLQTSIIFSEVLLEGFVYYYNKISLYHTAYFKGFIQNPPTTTPSHPKGYEFYRWVTLDGVPVHPDEYILETHLSNDGNLRLYAQYAIPSEDGDITSPEVDDESAIIHFLSAFGLDNTSGFVLLYVVLSMILLFIIVLLKLGSTVAGISQIGLSVLFWILGMLPIWVMLIISILVIYLLIMKQDTIGGGVDG
ncbi:MAG: hypothetical protein QXI16_03565 [Sulfolobaceae archaeon]